MTKGDRKHEDYLVKWNHWQGLTGKANNCQTCEQQDQNQTWHQSEGSAARPLKMLYLTYGTFLFSPNIVEFIFKLFKQMHLWSNE